MKAEATVVDAFLARRCCRGPRVWCEADRLYRAYRASGGSMGAADFADALKRVDGIIEVPGGLWSGVGLVEDWAAEDGGHLQRRQRSRPANGNGR